jgi:type IV secretory pathway TrbL component
MRINRRFTPALAAATLGACSLTAGAGSSPTTSSTPSSPASSAASSASSAPAGGENIEGSFSLQQRKEIKEAEATIENEHLANMNDTCGSSIGYDIDWEAFVEKTDSSFTIGKVAMECGGVMDGVAKVCKNDMGKEAIKGNLTKVHCTWNGDATYENLERYGPALGLEGGTLAAGYNRDVSNSASDTEEWLMQNL